MNSMKEIPSDCFFLGYNGFWIYGLELQKKYEWAKKW